LSAVTVSLRGARRTRSARHADDEGGVFEIWEKVKPVTTSAKNLMIELFARMLSVCH